MWESVVKCFIFVLSISNNATDLTLSSMSLQASFTKHSTNEYQVLDHNGFDTIGEYVTYKDAKSTVSRYNKTIFLFRSAVIKEAYKQTTTTYYDCMREEQLDSFADLLISLNSINDMDYMLNEDRMFLAENVTCNLEEQDYI
jgi:hypothetical protein